MARGVKYEADARDHKVPGDDARHVKYTRGHLIWALHNYALSLSV